VLIDRQPNRDELLVPPSVHVRVDKMLGARYKALKARLLASQSAVADLRHDLAQLRRDAHQALGTAPARSDLTIVEDLQRQTAELRVQLMHERDTTRSLQAVVAANAEDPTAAHEIARGYLRELNQTKDELLHTRRELVKLRTKRPRQALRRRRRQPTVMRRTAGAPRLGDV